MNTEQRNNCLALIGALESGHYKQTRHKCKSGDSYCVLGVATQLFMDKTGVGSWRKVGGDTYFSINSMVGRTNFTPVLEFFGISQEMCDAMTGMNDRGGPSFKDLAQFIRNHIQKDEVLV